jgi:hypothetical protein
MNDRHPQDDASLIARAKQLLDNSVTHLDRATTLRLQRARASALSKGSVPRWRWQWASGLVIVGGAALAVLLWTKQVAQENHYPLLFEDMELLTSTENVELAEDLEFYHWLADADTTG